MIEKQYRSLMRGPPYYYHPEIIAVQYILPCFVAAYLELERTDESNEAKEEYLQFVHELVKNYEESIFCLEFSRSVPKKDYYMLTPSFETFFFMNVLRNFEIAKQFFANTHLKHAGLEAIYAFAQMPSVCCCEKNCGL